MPCIALDEGERSAPAVGLVEDIASADDADAGSADDADAASADEEAAGSADDGEDAT